MEPGEFLTALWGEKPPGAMLIWTLPDKRSRWLTDPAEADELCRRLADYDIYTGVALAPPDWPPDAGRRLPAAQAHALAGVWIDLDLADPAHAKPGLPTDREAVASRLREAAPPPTVSISSGHGWHCWWLFPEPWLLTTPAARERAGELARRWQRMLQAAWRERGWALDSTFDLARVLRLPGTLNRKGWEPQRVTALETDGPRYAPAELAGYLPVDPTAVAGASPGPIAGNAAIGKRAAPQPAPAPAPGEPAGFALSAEASPDYDLLSRLFAEEPAARASWEHQRDDLPDQSLSGYDLSLAALAAAWQWSDQQIVNLLIAHRRRHAGNLKLRTDYYRRTLEKARRGATKSVTAELSPLVDLGIQGIRKTEGDPPEYRMVTAAGVVTIGRAEAILSQTAFRARLADATGMVLPRRSAREWDRMAQLIFASVEPEEWTERDETGEWVAGYIRERRMLDDLIEAGDTGSLYVDGAGHRHLFLTDLRKWLKYRLIEEPTSRQLANRLKDLGMERRTLHAGNTTRSAYRLCAEIEEKEAGKEPPII